MNHDVNGSGECAQCANPDLKGLHSCDRNSMSRRLGQASSGPTFSYANGALDDEETLQRRAHESAVRQALASEAKAHAWEHKKPAPADVAAADMAATMYRDRYGDASLKTLADGAFIRNRQDLGRLLGNAQGHVRTFTREEVLTVIRTLKASWQVHGSEDYDNGAKRAFADMAATIANME